MTDVLAVPITETSQVGAARRAAVALAGRMGMDEEHQGKVALIVTEAGNNLVRHTSGGELILRAVDRSSGPGVEIMALDSGPGIENVGRCLSDGYSTSGTAGQGLGAISRLANTFDIYSLRPGGTALAAQVWKDEGGRIKAGESMDAGQPLPPVEVGVVCLPKPGEEVCGDAWAYQERPGRLRLMVADGLGHGPTAAQASQEAVRMFHRHPDQSPTEIINVAHAALRSTRGAAVAVLEADSELREIRFAGIGNIAGTVVSSGGTSHLVSLNGTVGLQMRKVQEFVYPWPADGLLVMHSDGLSTQWRLEKYPGLQMKHPSLIAGVLYRDYKRGRDDVTVVTARVRC